MSIDWPKLVATITAAGAVFGGGGYFAGGLTPQEGFDACLSVIQTQAETIAFYQRNAQ